MPPVPITIFPGGQAFVQRQTPARVERDRRRVAGVLPSGSAMTIATYDPTIATLDGLVADAIAQLRAPTAIVGISYGGIIAARLAAQRPDLVSHLVLVSSAHRFSPEGLARVHAQIDSVTRGDLVGMVEPFVRVFRRPWFNALVALRVRMQRGKLAETLNDPAIIARGLAAVVEGAPLDAAALAKITARTLIVGGTRDQFFAGVFEETARAIPGAMLALFERETHMVAVERRRDVAARIRAFFA